MDRGTRLVVSRAGDGESRKRGQRVQTSSYKMGEFWILMYSMVTIVNILLTRVLLQKLMPMAGNLLGK